MFELSGYWQKVNRISVKEDVYKHESEKECFMELSDAFDRGSSSKDVEKYLVVPTFIRLGRKIRV